jgi:hypothetical protein
LTWSVSWVIHPASESHSLDAVGVVDGELGVVRRLDGLVDDAVDDAQRVEVEVDALVRALGDLLVLLVEVVEEL